MSGGLGKSSGSSTTIPSLSPEQNAQIKAQTEFFQNVVQPSYEQAVLGATDIYNNTAGGVTAAGQNLAGTAAQAQRTLGETGESALRTGISGLENLYSPEYEQQQLQAALLPAQTQYMQNVAGQQAQFGGAGQLGSARQALAGRATAGQTMAAQQSAAAQVENQIAQQRMAAGQYLTGAGQAGVTGALGAAGQGVTAAMAPQQLYNQYASVLFGTPAQSYSPDFRGTQSTSTKTSGSTANLGFNI